MDSWLISPEGNGNEVSEMEIGRNHGIGLMYANLYTRLGTASYKPDSDGDHNPGTWAPVARANSMIRRQWICD